MNRAWMIALALVLVTGAGCSKRMTRHTAGDDMSGVQKESGVSVESINERVPSSGGEDVKVERVASQTAPTPGDPDRVAPVQDDNASGRLMPDLHFDYDKALIRAEDKPLLMANADYLKKHASAKVQIEGHCDSRGTTEYNLDLGQRRAEATRRALVALGVAEARISVISYGEERPLCTDETDACWAQNRRTHAVLK